MLARLKGALSALRERRGRDEGFTLIELLVVVIIIGILAAIAIPIYLGVQNNAKDSSVKADLNNVKTAVVSYMNSNSQTFPPDLTVKTLSSYGFSGYSLTYPAGNAPAYANGTVPATGALTFCIQATSPTAKIWSVSDSGGVVSGACGG